MIFLKWKKLGKMLLPAPFSFGVPLYPANIHCEMSIKMPDNIISLYRALLISFNRKVKFNFSFSFGSNADEFNAMKLDRKLEFFLSCERVA